MPPYHVLPVYLQLLDGSVTPPSQDNPPKNIQIVGISQNIVYGTASISQLFDGTVTPPSRDNLHVKYKYIDMVNYQFCVLPVRVQLLDSSVTPPHHSRSKWKDV